MDADRPSVALSSVVAATAVASAIELANGYYTPLAAQLVLLAFVLPMGTLLLPRVASVEAACGRFLPSVAVAALALQGSMLTSFRPAHWLVSLTLMDVWSWHGAVFSLLLLAVGPGLGARTRLWGMALAFVLLGRWLVTHSPSPHVDVMMFWRDGIHALLAGENPFAMTYPNIYGKEHGYAAALVQNGRVLHGFPYPPVNLLLGLVGIGLGDVRYSCVVALVLAAGCMVLVGGPRQGFLTAALLLLTPRCLDLLEQGFIEPLAIALLAGIVLCEARAPRYTPVLLGLLLVSKQTMPLLSGCAWLLLARLPNRRAQLQFVGTTLASGTLVTLPFWLWSPTAFWHSVVRIQLMQLTSTDTLTVGRYLWDAWRLPFTGLTLSFFWLAATSLLLWWRAPRTPSGFALSLSLSYLAFLMFNQQAHANYYHMILAGMLISCAAARPQEAL